MRTNVDSQTIKTIDAGNGVTVVDVKTSINLNNIKAYRVAKDTAGWAAYLKRTRFKVEDDVAVIITTGSAVCSEGDKFDPTFGRQLAELRAQNESLMFVQELYQTLDRLCITELYYHDIVILHDNVKKCRKDLKKFIKRKIG